MQLEIEMDFFFQFGASLHNTRFKVDRRVVVDGLW